MNTMGRPTIKLKNRRVCLYRGDTQDGEAWIFRFRRLMDDRTIRRESIAVSNEGLIAMLILIREASGEMLEIEEQEKSFDPPTKASDDD